ncbi:MAG: tetratricopeptide repeat protein [Candidatus Rokuibacteriota bacterium]
MKRLLALGVVWLGLAAATPLPLTPPPPDLAALVPFAVAPLDKPALTVDAKLPPASIELPPLPLAALTVPAGEKPVLPTQPPRTLPCIGAWTGAASESLECGRARFQKGEYDDAVKALESAARPGSEREIATEARYWLAETYYRLGRIEQADWLFRQGALDLRQDWGPWALFSSGWTALRLGEAARARDAFTALLSRPVPVPLDLWGRFGLGLASYGVGRHEDALSAFGMVLRRPLPVGLSRDIIFWQGEALGRTGDAARAATELKRFVDGGPHPLLTTAQLRLAWWTMVAGRNPDAVAAFRRYLASAPAGGEREWGEAGLSLALLGTGDWPAARDTAAALGTRRSPLALPLRLRLLQGAVDSSTPADVGPIVQELLGSDLTPAMRSWVLLVKGEVDRAQGNRDEARTQFEMARTMAAGTPLAGHAGFRLARANYELREYPQALSDLTPLAAAPLPADLRIAVLILQGEAAYQSGDHATAGGAFRRVLLEFPDAPQTPLVRLAVAWTSLRQGRLETARREFLDFVRLSPDSPYAPDALVLAAELATEAGDLDAARELLDRIVQRYPTHPRTDLARLNRGILLVRTGDTAAAQTALRDWLGRASFPALFGRAHAALGAAMLGNGDSLGAQREFTLAQRDGLGPFASLGLGAVAMGRSRWDDAAKSFTEARDSGTPGVTAAAEYGLAAIEYAKKGGSDFKQPAQAALAALPPGPRSASRAGALLYVVTGIAVAEKDWPGALGSARRLVDDYPSHEAADDGLERVAAGAAAASAWPVALQADTLLRQRYPRSPFTEAAGVRVAEALLETGKADEAKREIDQVLAARPNDGRATLLLARVRESGGDRSGALEAYARAARDGQAQGSGPALLGHGRLLVEDKQWSQARGVFEKLLKSEDKATVAEAARGIGDSYAGEGDQIAAAEYYLTAAYVAPTSTQGRKALLAAGQSFATAKQNEAAAIAYRKLLAQSDLPSDLAVSARQGLAALPR